MTSADDYSEQGLIEQPAIELFKELGYDVANCFYETVGEDSTLGRRTTHEVVLVPRLREALERLNPRLPDEAIAQAIEELTKDRSALNPVVANHEVYRLLKGGVRVTITNEAGDQETETVLVIDWNDPEKNDFFLASQFWVSGEVYKRRVDLLGFINGLPLILIELKATHRRLENAYRNNVRDYKSTIPQVFWYNAFIIVSNGSDSKIGSMSADWEHFNVLTKPDMKLTQKERNQVKKASRDLLTTLKTEKLVLDWRKRQQSRAEVRVTIEDILDKALPDKFTEEVFNQKCQLVYQHIYDSYFGEGRSVYAGVA